MHIKNHIELAKYKQMLDFYARENGFPFDVADPTPPEKRTLAQNRKLRVWEGILSDHTGFNSNALHEKLIEMFAPIQEDKTGRLIGKRTRDMSMIEMTAYMNRVSSWALDEFGIILD